MLRPTIIYAFLCTIQLSNTLPIPRHRLLSRSHDPSNSTQPYTNWPSYADLPLNASYPAKAAWGVWGPTDVHGALNHITPSTIKHASSEIHSGVAIPLNLELSYMPRPILPQRPPPIHLFQPFAGFTDDVVTLNTQASTQMDGLRHFSYSENEADGGGYQTRTYRFYNDLIRNYEEVVGPESERTDVLGIQQAAEKGIVARGVLLDYKGWMDSKGEMFDAFTTLSVPVSDLDKVAQWQGLPPNWSLPGDILLVRFGWLAAFGKLNETEKQALVLGPGNYIGIPANHASAEWLWDKKLAMVGSDNPAFELSPLIKGDFGGGEMRNLHEILIAGWGTSILEFIDTEKLAKALHEAGRSTFFMTIQAMNVRGGVASPPNAMAIL